MSNLAKLNQSQDPIDKGNNPTKTTRNKFAAVKSSYEKCQMTPEYLERDT